MARRSGNTDTDSAPLGIEAPLWAAADKLRSNMDPAEYRHVVLGLVLLKYVSDAFLSHQDRLRANAADPDSDFYIRARGALPGCRGPDEYLAENVFWVPARARWDMLQANARQSDIGQRVDDAMRAIEDDNPKLRGVLPSLRPAEPQRPHPGRADETVGSLQRWNPDQLYLGRSGFAFGASIVRIWIESICARGLDDLSIRANTSESNQYDGSYRSS